MHLPYYFIYQKGYGFFILLNILTEMCEVARSKGRGHWAVYYSSPQSFIIKFKYLLA